jgi:phosphoribosyl 1,2-cyclic phosphate phosphodiesterase
MSKLKLTILGSGTSTGVPVPGCSCAVCLSGEPRNQRYRTSALIQGAPHQNILIDATADLRSQALRFGVKRVDAVLYTHAHADHILGTDDLRVFNFVINSAIPCFGSKETLAGVRQTFPYIFNQDEPYEGGFIAQLALHEINELVPFETAGIKIIPFPLKHGKTAVMGYRIGELAYATDCNVVPEPSQNIVRGIKYLVLDGLRYQSHKTHFTIPQAIEMATQLGVEKTWLTHTTHTVDYDEVSANLPSHVALAYDGLEIAFEG